MYIYIVRHGLAEVGANGDAKRRLTSTGREQLEQAAHGLRRSGVQIDRIVCSPLVRTVQTADILRAVLAPSSRVHQSDALAPHGSAEATVDEVLEHHARVQALMLVGHLPDVLDLVGLWGAPSLSQQPAFAPGAMACIAFAAAPERHVGRLVWFKTVEQLRALGGQGKFER